MADRLSNSLSEAITNLCKGVRVLGWGTYSNGTYAIENNPAADTLVVLRIGYTNRYSVVKTWGGTGDMFKIYTEDGWLTITITDSTHITISGAGSNSPLRSITAHPNFVFHAV